MLDVIAAIDKGIGPGAALAGLGALGVLLALALGRGAVGLAAYARSRRGAGEQRRAEAGLSPVTLARARAELGPRTKVMRREDIAGLLLAHLREQGFTGPMLVQDIDAEIEWMIRERAIEPVNTGLVREALKALPGVRVERARLATRDDLRRIPARLKALGLKSERPTIYHISDRPVAGRSGADAVPDVARTEVRQSRTPNRAATGQQPDKAAKHKKNRTITAVRTPSEQGELLVGYELAA